MTSARPMHHRTIIEGATGIIFPIFGLVVSLLAEIETWLRLASLTAGLVVSVLMAIKIYRDITKKPKNPDES